MTVNDATASGQLLDGLKVLDLSMVLAGPYGSMLLADMGADVIKVEPPRGDPLRLMEPKIGQTSIIYASVNRNKRSLVLDLHQPDALEVFLELVGHVDVVYNNFRPGVMGRLGLTFDALRAHNPTIISANLSGFGDTGPRRLSPAFDAAIQALAGGMSLTGHAGQAPARAGIPIADLGGGVYLTLAVLAALFKRDRTGQAVELDISMLDTQISLLMYWAGLALNTGVDPPPQGSGNVNSYPYGAFPTSDGHVIVTVFTEGFWQKFCEAIQRPDLATDALFAENNSRVKHRGALEAELITEFAQRTTAEWLAILDEHDVPCAPVNSVTQAMADPQVLARSMKIDVDIDDHTFSFAGNPIKTVPHTPASETRPPPRLGQHSYAILEDILDKTPEQIEALTRSGALLGEPLEAHAPSSTAHE